MLNLQRKSSVELELVRQMQVREEMVEPPSEEEFEEAILKLRCRKAGGESGILQEMLKVTRKR